MPEIIIRLHKDLADRILAAGPDGQKCISALWRQANRVISSHGRRIAYAPAVFPDGSRCAMSVHVGLRGMIIEVDRPGTLIPGRDVVPERDPLPRAPAPRKR